MSETPGIQPGEVLLETAQAAEILGVPPRTLLRMVERGVIDCDRTEGTDSGAGHRRFKTSDVQALKRKGSPEIDRANTRLTQTQLDATVSSAEAQEILGVTFPTLWRWEKEGKIVAHRPTVANKLRFDRKTIEAIAEQRKSGERDE